MQIIDQTPYRSETGEIDILGRIQGTFKYGLAWFNNLKAQEAVIAILNKQLDKSFILLRNVTLPEIEITLPMILLGPPGVFLVNVTHERGVYSAKGDEWGTVAGTRFVPARVNQMSRTMQLTKVLQVYLDRHGYKGALAVEPIFMAADPGMHIESVRPTVRIVMSDALERFAVSLAQTRGTLAPDYTARLAHVIVKGTPPKERPVPTQSSAPAPSASSYEFTDDTPLESGDGEMNFSFQEEETEQAEQPEAQPSRPKPAAAKPAARKKKNFLGLSKRQMTILGVLLLVGLCVVLSISGYILYTLANV